MIIEPFNYALHFNQAKKLEIDIFGHVSEYSTCQGFVLIDNEKLVGVCLFKELNKELWNKKTLKYPSINILLGPYWNLSIFFIANEYSKKGFGTKMLDLIITLADTYNVTMCLRAYRGANYLLKLYNRFGFIKQDRTENDIGSPIMIRFKNNDI